MNDGEQQAGQAADQSGDATEHRPRRRQRAVSPITRRILAVNVLALGILVAGLLYLGEYRQNLISSELGRLEAEAEMFAAALGEGAVGGATSLDQELIRDTANRIVRRMVETTDTRARLFRTDGRLVADSRRLVHAGREVQIEQLPPPEEVQGPVPGFLDIYDRIVNLLLAREPLPVYHEDPDQTAGDYPEVQGALQGETERVVRRLDRERLMLTVAVPVQRFKQVAGALLVSTDSASIDKALLEVRLDILKIFAVALSVTIALSIYLASTIARPINRLARAADRIRHSHNRRHVIPEVADRDDEIGDLARALREMTEALWRRMDAIERFAADVSHEIKNPLTSLRSAVETCVRLEDPEQQRKLLAIIEEDVQRLDRLITDISDASRVDAELSRAETRPVGLARMLTMLADLYRAANDVQVTVEVPEDDTLEVAGLEDRLVQVFRNLIANAITFSPDGGRVVLRAERRPADRNGIVVTVEDEGPGIPPGSEKAIFERFYSQRPESEKFGTHSGLGLSIAKQIVEAHGGSVEAENRTGGDGAIAGARFIVRLPAPS